MSAETDNFQFLDQTYQGYFQPNTDAKNTAIEFCIFKSR